MLEMENIPARKPLKEYFYGGASWVNIVLVLVFIYSLSKGTEVAMLVFALCVAIKIILLYQRPGTAEGLYDSILEQDIVYLKKRAVEIMGLIEEEFSLIEPIVLNGYATNEVVSIATELTAEKKGFNLNPLKWIWSVIKVIPMGIYRYVRRLLGLEDHLSRAIFYEGNDKKVRYSLVSMVMIVFTEQQVVAYVCNYDIALGIILKEYTREMFYRDIDFVKYGEETVHVFTDNGKFRRILGTRLLVAVPSGKNISALELGETDMLDNQIKAMDSLIRSKKEEMN